MPTGCPVEKSQQETPVLWAEEGKMLNKLENRYGYSLILLLVFMYLLGSVEEFSLPVVAVLLGLIAISGIYARYCYVKYARYKDRQERFIERQERIYKRMAEADESDIDEILADIERIKKENNIA